MATEAPSTGSSALSPRAAIAQLTLQLRASLQEAAAAEAEADSVDQQLALSQLRARLTPLLDERRRSLEVALTQVRAEAGDSIEAARREAADIVSGAAPAFVTPVASEVAAVTTAVDVEPPTIAQLAVDPPTIEQPVVEQPVVEPASPAEQIDVPITSVIAAIEPQQSAVAGMPAINVVIDAEAFARVFATVFATVLHESSFGSHGNNATMMPALAPAKPQLRHARHLDVLLLGLATIIVVVILISWLA